jgi:hypothetical protein
MLERLVTGLTAVLANASPGHGIKLINADHGLLG